MFISLEINFIASAIGWAIPAIKILFGPLRDCEYPIIFRSNKVKKATEIITIIIKNIKLTVV